MYLSTICNKYIYCNGYTTYVKALCILFNIMFYSECILYYTVKVIFVNKCYVVWTMGPTEFHFWGIFGWWGSFGQDACIIPGQHSCVLFT